MTRTARPPGLAPATPRSPLLSGDALRKIVYQLNRHEPKHQAATFSVMLKKSVQEVAIAVVV